MASANEELLKIGAKYELCGETESASEIYFTYVKEEALLSDGTDALEALYGRKVYDEPIRSYRQAAEYGFIATCAKKLMETVRGKFPEEGCFETPTGTKKTDAGAFAFFEWLAKNKTVRVDDYKILKKAKASFDKSQKIAVEVSSSVARRRLEEVVYDLVNGNTKAVDKKLW